MNKIIYSKQREIMLSTHDLIRLVAVLLIIPLLHYYKELLEALISNHSGRNSVNWSEIQHQILQNEKQHDFENYYK